MLKESVRRTRNGGILKATTLKYSRRYLDDSGDEFAVTGDIEKGIVTVHSRSTEADIPIDELGWFIDALYEIKHEREKK